MRTLQYPQAAALLPGVNGEICTICCGTEREQTIDCPLECEYLREAHPHEEVPELDPATVPNQDIGVTEECLEKNQALVLLPGPPWQRALSARRVPSPIMISAKRCNRSSAHRTLESGLYYEALPTNPYALAIHESVQARVADLRRRESEATGPATTIRDTMVLRSDFSAAARIHVQQRPQTQPGVSRFSEPVLRAAPRARMTAPQPDEPRIIL